MNQSDSLHHHLESGSSSMQVSASGMSPGPISEENLRILTVFSWFPPVQRPRRLTYSAIDICIVHDVRLDIYFRNNTRFFKNCRVNQDGHMCTHRKRDGIGRARVHMVNLALQFNYQAAVKHIPF